MGIGQRGALHETRPAFAERAVDRVQCELADKRVDGNGVEKEDDVKIRAFDGTLGDARGIIEIDRATFADCPYSAEQIAALEADPGQYAWVAEEGDHIVGYVSAFPTHSLAASRWEVDELAVHPQAQGRGIGTALVARALAVGAQQSGLHEARALVAVDNLASQRVFVKNGFRAVDRVHLLAYRTSGRAPRVPRPGAPVVRLVQTGESRALARLLGGEDADAGDAARMAGQLLRADVQYRVAVDAPGQMGRIELLGGAEWIHVRTLQYEGLWVESLAVTKRGAAESRVAKSLVAENRAALALFGAAIERIKLEDGMDLMGYLAAPRDRALYSAAVAEGMTLIDEYTSFVREW